MEQLRVKHEVEQLVRKESIKENEDKPKTNESKSNQE